MKPLLIIKLILLSTIACAQWNGVMPDPMYSPYNPGGLETIVPLTTLAGTFILNETMIHSAAFQNLTIREQNMKMTKQYLGGAVLTVGLYYGISYVKSHKKQIKRNWKKLFK